LVLRLSLTFNFANLQDNYQDVVILKAQAVQPSQNGAVVPHGTVQACQGCSAAQQAVDDLRHQLAPLQRGLSAKGSNLAADSMPSTQDHSGDTNDDR